MCDVAYAFQAERSGRTLQRVDIAKNSRGKLTTLTSLQAHGAQLFEIGVKPLDNILRVSNKLILCVVHRHRSLTQKITKGAEKRFLLVGGIGRGLTSVRESFAFRRFFVEVALYRIEDSIYELGSFVG